MNKKELIDSMAAATGLTKKDCGAALDAFLSSVSKTLSAGNKVQITGFGSFEVKERKERIARNPRTLTTITIPASRVPVFKAGKALKDTVSK